MNTTRTLFTTTLAVATALTLTACSSDNSSGMSGMNNASTSTASPTPSASASTSAFNAQDLEFAMMMKPHHEQAVEMADIMLAKDGISQDVATLATEIKTSQGPELDQLEEWVTVWGAGVSMQHDMGGMMSDDDMAALDSATGTDAEKLFLEQMTAHHEAAVEMAQTEVDGGQNPDAVEMANTIVTTQTEEIATMQSLLASR